MTTPATNALMIPTTKVDAVAIEMASWMPLTMAGMSGVTLSESLVRQTISRSLEVIVQLSRGTDGKRRIASISEITGMEGNVITMQEIFLFQQRGTGEGGQILGEFVATGVRPRVLEKIARYGVDPMTIAREFGAE